MIDGVSCIVVYDDEDEEDIVFKLGVGCGGVVYLVFVLVNESN